MVHTEVVRDRLMQNYKVFKTIQLTLEQARARCGSLIYRMTANKQIAISRGWRVVTNISRPTFYSTEFRNSVSRIPCLTQSNHLG